LLSVNVPAAVTTLLMFSVGLSTSVVLASRSAFVISSVASSAIVSGTAPEVSGASLTATRATDAIAEPLATAPFVATAENPNEMDPLKFAAGSNVKVPLFSAADDTTVPACAKFPASFSVPLFGSDVSVIERNAPFPLL